MEYLDIVDENGVPTGKTVERTIAHSQGIKHRCAHVWVVNMIDGKYNVLLQKRAADKDSFPNCLDTSSAGHIPAGCEVLESAVRELHEELGIETDEASLKYVGTFKAEYQKQFHGKLFWDNEVDFIYMYDKKIKIEELVLQEEEVSMVCFQPLDVVLEASKNHDPAYCVPYPSISRLATFLNQ